DLSAAKDFRTYGQSLLELFPKISAFSLRETKAGSGLQLPGKVYYTEVAKWEPTQRAIYETARQDLQLEVRRNGVVQKDDIDLLLKRLLRLLQIASNPAILDETYEKEPGKVTALTNLLDATSSANEKAI